MALIGNLISLAGCILMVATGFVKKKERILALQCVQFAILGAAHLVLGAVSGFISCVISIVRNLILPRVRSTFWLKAGFILLQILLTLSAGSFAPIELLPILAAVLFTWFLDTKDPVLFKTVIILAQVMWLVYDLWYGNFTAAAFDVLTVGSNLAGIRMLRRK